jgi:hypothetical protein
LDLEETVLNVLDLSLDFLLALDEGLQHFCVDLDLIVKEFIADRSIGKDEGRKSLSCVGSDYVQTPPIQVLKSSRSSLLLVLSGADRRRGGRLDSLRGRSLFGRLHDPLLRQGLID